MSHFAASINPVLHFTSYVFLVQILCLRLLNVGQLWWILHICIRPAVTSTAWLQPHKTTDVSPTWTVWKWLKRYEVSYWCCPPCGHLKEYRSWWPLITQFTLTASRLLPTLRSPQRTWQQHLSPCPHSPPVQTLNWAQKALIKVQLICPPASTDLDRVFV